MKFVEGTQQTPEEMMLKVSESVEAIELSYTKAFGQVPMPDSIAWVCTGKRCGWWNDSSDELILVEVLYTARTPAGILLTTEKPTAGVQVLCPRCRARIKAIAKHVYLEQAQKDAVLTMTKALKNRG